MNNTYNTSDVFLVYRDNDNRCYQEIFDFLEVGNVIDSDTDEERRLV
jgi:hypothetical protein